MPLTGLEPVRYCYRGILSPLCLPISPQRHNKLSLNNYTTFSLICQDNFFIVSHKSPLQILSLFLLQFCIFKSVGDRALIPDDLTCSIRCYISNLPDKWEVVGMINQNLSAIKGYHSVPIISSKVADLIEVISSFGLKYILRTFNL